MEPDTGFDPSDYPEDEVVAFFDEVAEDCQGETPPRSLTGLEFHGYQVQGFNDGVNSSRLPTDIANEAPIAGQLVHVYRWENTCDRDTLAATVSGDPDTVVVRNGYVEVGWGRCQDTGNTFVPGPTTPSQGF